MAAFRLFVYKIPEATLIVRPLLRLQGSSNYHKVFVRILCGGGLAVRPICPQCLNLFRCIGFLELSYWRELIVVYPPAVLHKGCRLFVTKNNHSELFETPYFCKVCTYVGS